MGRKEDHIEALTGLKKFLEEAKKILTFNPEANAEHLERADEILKRLDPLISQVRDGHEFGINEILSEGGDLKARVRDTNLIRKPLIASDSSKAPTGPFKDSWHEKRFREIEKRVEGISPVPPEIVTALTDWLKDKWKTPIFWESQDPIEQTWNLQTLARSLFTAAGMNREPEFVKGARQWGSEILGEQRKLAMGAPSIVWCVHEIVHLILNEEEEEPAWVATTQLLKAAFADIDPAYAQERLETEFDNPPVSLSKPQPRTKSGWSTDDQSES